jgi:hypothetical protein
MITGEIKNKVDQMWEWFKNKNVIIKSLIGIIGVFIIICLLIIAVAYTPLYSPITNGEWATVIATFFAGTLGGLIALGGIWWQLNHEKEEKKKRVKKYLKYIISQNKTKQNDFLLEFIRSLTFRSVIAEMKIIESSVDKFDEFSEDYFDKNIESILNLENCDSIMKLQTKIKKINKIYHDNYESYYDRKSIFENKDDNFEDLISLIGNYSAILTYIDQHKTVVANLDKFLETFNELNKKPELILSSKKNIDLLKMFSSRIRTSNFQEEEYFTICNILNEQLLSLLVTVVGIYVPKTIFSDKISRYIFHNLSANKLSFEVYNLLKGIEIE